MSFSENIRAIRQKCFFSQGSIKHMSMEEGVMHFLHEYSIYSMFNSEKLIDFILALCSQCELYMLTPSNDVKKTIEIITQRETSV